MKTILLFALGLMLTGCASIHVCDKGAHTLATVNNTCWYLFDCLPMASGDPEHPNKISTCLFRSTTTLENNMRLLETAMRVHEAESLINVNSYTTDESVFFFLLTRHACYTSAELVMPNAESTLPTKEKEKGSSCKSPNP